MSENTTKEAVASEEKREPAEIELLTAISGSLREIGSMLARIDESLSSIARQQRNMGSCPGRSGSWSHWGGNWGWPGGESCPAPCNNNRHPHNS